MMEREVVYLVLHTTWFEHTINNGLDGYIFIILNSLC